MIDDQDLLKREYIYCNKRRLYMTANLIRNAKAESYLNPDIAADVLEFYEEYKDIPTAFIPTGDEFDPFPPTSAGRVFFAESIAQIMHDVDAVRRIRGNNEIVAEGSLEAVFFGAIGEVVDVMDRAAKSYLMASGVNPDGTPITDKAKRKEYREEFYAAREEYEKVVKNHHLRCGDRLIEKMRNDAGIPERLPVDIVAEDPPLEELIKTSANAELLFFDEITKMRQIIGDSMTEAAERAASRDELFKKAIEIFLDKSIPFPRRRLMKFAFFRYRQSVDRIIKKSFDIREASLYYLRCLINDEPVDRIIFEKIKEYLDREVELIYDDRPLAEIPKFYVPVEKNSLDDMPGDFASIMELAGKLRNMKDTYPYLFEAQCLMSILHDADKLAVIVSNSKLCSESIDVFTKSDSAKELSDDQWIDLMEGWVLADAMLRVSYPVMDFIIDHQEETVGEATEALMRILPNISYIEASANSRLVLREVILERSGYYVS